MRTLRDLVDIVKDELHRIRLSSWEFINEIHLNMFPVLHLHHIHTVHNANFQTTQQICAVFPFSCHLKAKRTRNENITVNQLLFVRRHHDHSPSLPSNLDAESKIVVTVSAEVHEMVYGEVGAGRRIGERIFLVLRQGERRDEGSLVLNLSTGRSEREEVGLDIAKSKRSSGKKEQDLRADKRLVSRRLCNRCGVV